MRKMHIYLQMQLKHTAGSLVNQQFNKFQHQFLEIIFHSSKTNRYSTIISKFIELLIVHQTIHFHRKRCPSKFSFKYVNQNQSVGGTITECMKCHLRLLSPPLFDMKMHSERCPMKWQSNPAQTMNSPFASTNFSVNSNNQLNGKSNSVACVYYETMVNQKEIDAQRKASTVKNSCSVWVTRNGFKRKYIQGSNGPEQHHECQTCKLLIRKPTMHSLQSHR